VQVAVVEEIPLFLRRLLDLLTVCEVHHISRNPEREKTRETVQFTATWFILGVRETNVLHEAE
jgi:hypothetical protein